MCAFISIGVPIGSLIVALFSFIVAILTFFTTKRIAFVQQWESFVSEYRSAEFGSAVKALCDFFIDDCDRDINKIKTKYIDRYKSETALVKSGRMQDAESLHFQRRLLAQYYWQLCSCAEQNRLFSNRWIKRYFNKNEMNIMAIVYEMGRAASKNDTLFRSLWKESPNGNLTKDEEQSDINACIERLYAQFGKLFKKDTRAALPLQKDDKASSVAETKKSAIENKEGLILPTN